MTRRLALVLLVALGLVAVVAPPAPIAAEGRPLYLDRARPAAIERLGVPPRWLWDGPP